ncbi:uncharacterized protein LOC111406139 isoform X2 [Olea europaea var. sylvestris]|uniref:uncharacterized protein LOC111406139 isoform X2 n=1 Tax=Olea europaea var. sylvestris TaxID=158386 RepID=UPI000C1D24EF|nr:uncharacterized protein LOC111406139 isoform X2 [Olea europaea var. sylvestris]
MGNPELSVQQFDSVFTFKEDGKNSGWWYTSVMPRKGGSLVLDTPSSVKKWKEEWLYVSREWQFHSAGVNREDVVPRLYHSLYYKKEMLTKDTQRRAKVIRSLSKRQRSCKFVILDPNLFRVGLVQVRASSSAPSSSAHQDEMRGTR